MSVDEKAALLCIAVAVAVLAWDGWRTIRRRMLHRAQEQAMALTRHPASRAKRGTWGCECGQWMWDDQEPWSHTLEGCQPLRESL